jgi:hypothetical protein
MNNKIKSILFACLMLVGVNAVKAATQIPAGTYYFLFDFRTDKVYEVEVFHNIDDESKIEIDRTAGCNCGLTFFDDNIKHIENTASGITTLKVVITEDARGEDNQLFIKVNYGPTNNNTSWYEPQYLNNFGTPKDIGGKVYVCNVTKDAITWGDELGLTCDDIADCTPILIYSASSGGSVTAVAGSETVSSGTAVAPGTKVTLTAIPQRYYEFSHWVTADGVVGYERNHIITMPNHTYSVQAIFTPEDKDASLGAECEDCFYVTP